MLDKLVCLFLLDSLRLTQVECLLLNLPVTIHYLSSLLLYLISLTLKLLNQILQCLLLVIFLLQEVILGRVELALAFDNAILAEAIV